MDGKWKRLTSSYLRTEFLELFFLFDPSSSCKSMSSDTYTHEHCLIVLAIYYITFYHHQLPQCIALLTLRCARKPKKNLFYNKINLTHAAHARLIEEIVVIAKDFLQFRSFHIRLHAQIENGLCGWKGRREPQNHIEESTANYLRRTDCSESFYAFWLLPPLYELSVFILTAVNSLLERTQRD